MYREIKTVEEAECFLGKKIIMIKNNENPRIEIVNKISLKDNKIYLNHYYASYLLANATLPNGEPVGVKYEPEFKLPELTEPELLMVYKFKMPKTAVQIKKYILENKLDGNEYMLFYGYDNKRWNNNPVDFQSTSCLTVFYFLTVETLEEAETLCKQLNDAGVVL